MSLVDKLTDVQVGDLIVLEREDEDTVGYVVDYASDTVTICDRNTRDKKSGCIRKFKFFSPYNRGITRTLGLKYFDSYQVLRKFERDTDN